jgi:NAD(P)-dependent dehydrogenase (short-subunit alcohol dehydrogenase family)
VGNLKDRVAVVTGASRGAGRGIALALGERGATVYVTGRSVKGRPTTDKLPGAIEETAEAVSARVGAGVAGYENFTESPEYAGRAVAALAADPSVLDKSGQTLSVGDLAQEYGFTDIDGRLIPPFKMPDDYPYK